MQLSGDMWHLRVPAAWVDPHSCIAYPEIQHSLSMHVCCMVPGMCFASDASCATGATPARSIIAMHPNPALSLAVALTLNPNLTHLQMKIIHRNLAERDVPLGSAQIQFSLLSWGGPQQDLKDLCDDLGVTVIAYSPLALGLLSGDVGMAIHMRCAQASVLLMSHTPAEYR